MARRPELESRSVSVLIWSASLFEKKRFAAVLIRVSVSPTETMAHASTRWPVDFERVRRLSTGDPDQQGRLRRLNEVLGQRFRVLDEELALFEGGHRGADLTPTMRRGEHLMTTARAIIDDMEQEEARLDVIRQGAALRRWQLTMVLFVGGAFASLSGVHLLCG